MTLELIITGAIVLSAACALLLAATLILAHLVRSTRKALALHDNDYVLSELKDEEKARTTLRGKMNLWFVVMLVFTVLYLGYFGPGLLFAASVPGRP
ncbi:hypothetical protein [Paenarthrobacter nitroguajacolicus]|uniref:hypothetical protein n=1 Tax=Paenarthrobacter nitroguajacolicus TaxID=211146 RepID=UPI004053C616